LLASTWRAPRTSSPATTRRRTSSLTGLPRSSPRAWAAASLKSRSSGLKSPWKVCRRGGEPGGRCWEGVDKWDACNRQTTQSKVKSKYRASGWGVLARRCGE
jgi:hypothetical protein